jgi:hypothetical protein
MRHLPSAIALLSTVLLSAGLCLTGCASSLSSSLSATMSSSAAARHLADGKYYGIIKRLDADRLEVNFEQFSIVPSQVDDQRAQDDHVAWEGTMTQQVGITYFESPPGEPSNGQIGTYPATLTQLSQIVAKDPGALFKFTVRSGLIQDIDGVYMA